MIIKKRDPFTGQTNEMNIQVSAAQYQKWRAGALAQHAFPNISADEREFIMTGITKESWQNTFPNEDIS
tara:strand:- start:1817 stop:2023 length:207 start_codon:yes stop_codon:yes gene_type:complete